MWPVARGCRKAPGATTGVAELAGGAATGVVPPFINNSAMVFDHDARRWQPTGSHTFDMPLVLRDAPTAQS